MDAKIIKSQIAYWEAQEKDAKAQIKVASDQLKTIQATIKSLKSMLPKEREFESIAERQEFVEETQHS